MLKSIFRSAWVAVVVGIGLSGCTHCARESCAAYGAPCDTCMTAACLPVHPLAPIQAGAVYSSPLPQPVLQPPPISTRVPAAQVETRGYNPPVGDWQPSAGGSAPITAPANPEPRPEVARLYPPQTGEPPAAQPALPPAPLPAQAAAPLPAQPQAPETPRLLKPGVTEEPPAASVPPKPAVAEQPSGVSPPQLTRPPTTSERPATPSLPVGIPQFAVAKKGVTSGLKPSLDGLEWLQANGYRAVLHIKKPGKDDSADRQVVESHKMKYLSIEVSPKTLTRAVVEAFNHVVDDPDNRPLFVYDQDGILAGGLWYLYFRTAEQESDEVARVKAERLGLKTTEGGVPVDIWLAIQQYLGESSR